MYVHNISFIVFLMLKVDDLFNPIPTDFIDGPSATVGGGGGGAYSNSQADNRNNPLLRRGLLICLCVQ